MWLIPWWEVEWQLTHINTGYGDYTGWYFNSTTGLMLASSEMSGWLGTSSPPFSFLLLLHFPPFFIWCPCLLFIVWR